MRAVVALLLLTTAAHADRWASATVGPVTLGFGPERGLTVRYHSETVVEGATINFHDGQWRTVYHSIPRDTRDVQVVDQDGGKALHMLGEAADGSFHYEYQAVARPDRTVRIVFSYTRDKDLPFGCEYCVTQLAEMPIVGCAFTAKGPGARAGKVKLEATSPDISDSTWVAHDVSELSLDSRVGKVTFATDGEPWFGLFDGRLRFSGSPVNGWFWGGKLGDAAPVGETRRLDFTLRFEGEPAQPGPALDVSGKGEPAREVAFAVKPEEPQGLPTLIPQPREVTPGTGWFAIRRNTPIIAGRQPSAAKLRSVKALQDELQARFGLALPVRADRGERDEGGIVLSQGKAASHAEGYVLQAVPHLASVRGDDEAGLYWGVQTLLQLLQPGPDGPRVPAVIIRDWPDFALRGAHLCLGEHDLKFAERLISRVLPRYKLNCVVLEIESIQWKSHPELSQKGPTPEDLGRLAQVCREHFIEPIPQIQSGGHCDYWLFRDGKHRELAENPERPYNYCPSNPDTYKLMFELYDEVWQAMRPKWFHLGHDELDDDYGICPRCKGKDPAALFAGDVKQLHDWWAAKGVPVMVWGDMLLAPVDGPGGNDAFNGGGKLNLRRAVPLLPKDLIIADWHYGGEEKYPSLDFWQQQGFGVVAGPWYGLDNIAHLSADAAQHKALGFIGTTWCGLADEEVSLRDSLQWIGPLVYTADCAWNPGQRAPDKLAYDPSEQLLQALAPATTLVPRPGWVADLSAAGTRALADADGSGWLGYGPDRDLSGLPTGEATLGGIAWRIAPRAVVTAGTLAPAGLPGEVDGIRIGRRARTVAFLQTCGWPADGGAVVARYRIHYADGTQEEAPLTYGRDVAAWYAKRPVSRARVVWRGQTPTGQPLWLYAWEWSNPHSEREIASVDVVSAGGRAAPAVLAVTGW
ncbi:MAG: beta-N-acetylhexosaminidase [Armatimonadetes bacterium]|nr:beta-N-acetylhexosaminidase [Armatimonadota bacterium]